MKKLSAQVGHSFATVYSPESPPVVSTNNKEAGKVTKACSTMVEAVIPGLVRDGKPGTTLVSLRFDDTVQKRMIKKPQEMKQNASANYGKST